MGTFRHGGTAVAIDDVDLMHVERVVAHALADGSACTLVIEDESPTAPIRVLLDGSTPMELHYERPVDDEQLDDARLRIMLAALVDSGALHVPRAG